MHKNSFKRHAIMGGLLMMMILVIATHAKDPSTSLHLPAQLKAFLSSPSRLLPHRNEANKASWKERGICCVTKCITWKSYIQGITFTQYLCFVKNCCKQLCRPGINMDFVKEISLSQ